ncbi:DUF4180 domain-containing protein [Devosia rhizoryzae]|uniref:DUF4180 domain-containing protein n=1 Tax=Devosia rhizoryzae TaxID=2774137 RepID=A0ABX7C242_9HYPH|nr:DUF4180 domain-containing protein [Devosia rhizoryzae]QQR38136.1 DUF4180 domain-containing protein [Devosia rhizoryzae]
MPTETHNGLTIFFADATGPTLGSEQDALDLIGETYGTETDMIAVPVARFGPSFFDLSSKQAGHFFQKMQNYGMRLAILGDIGEHTSRSKALTNFVGETNRIGHHRFAATREDLIGGRP